MIKKYKINVDCANCANKMEEKINKLDEVKNANINFLTSKMTIEYENNCDIDKVFETIKTICKRIDSDVEIK